MAKTKHKEYFQRMVKVNKKLFEHFRLLHDEYALNPSKLQERFNIEGEEVLKVIREWEQKLCMQSEKAGYAKFTNSLAEKFWNEVRTDFPEIDNIGLIIQKTSVDQSFVLKRIHL